MEIKSKTRDDDGREEKTSMFRGGVRLVNAMSSTPALRRAHWQQTMLRGTYLVKNRPTEKKRTQLRPRPGSPRPLHPSRSLNLTPDFKPIHSRRLAVKDPKKSLQFYEDHLGMTLIDKYKFEKYDFSLYFLASLKPGETYDLTPGTKEAHAYLWDCDRVTLELTVRSLLLSSLAVF